jgi:chromosome segregation ATPase
VTTKKQLSLKTKKEMTITSIMLSKSTISKVSEFYQIDPSTIRFRPKIPFHKLTIEDEENIPERPKDLVEKPNDKHYEKEIKAIDDKINKHRENIEGLKKKINEERNGNNPDRERLKKERDELNKQLEPIQAEIEQRLEKLSGPEEQKKKLKAEKDSLQKEIDIFDVKIIDLEIKSIQEKLGFSSLNMSEEKKLIDKKNRLETQRPKVSKFSTIKDKLDALYKANSTGYDKVKEFKDKKKVLVDKIKIISDKLKAIKASTEINNQNIVNLDIQVKSIKDENDRLYQQKRDLQNEWDTKWRRYEEQQNLVKYIDEALKKISLLKKKADKEKKRKEKLEQKEDANEEKDIDDGGEQEEDFPNAYEIATCEWLISYFKSVIGEHPEKKESKSTISTVSQSTDDNLKPIERKDNEHELGLSEVSHAKKKKGPKVSKRDQKADSTGLLVIDSTVVNKIKNVKLSPPVFKKDVHEFIEKLEKAHHCFLAGPSEENTKCAENNVVKTERKPPVEETKVEQPKATINMRQEVILH